MQFQLLVSVNLGEAQIAVGNVGGGSRQDMSVSASIGLNSTFGGRSYSPTRPSFLLKAETINTRVMVDRINLAPGDRQTAEVDPAFQSGAALIKHLPRFGIQGI